MIIFGFLSLLVALWQKCATKFEISLIFLLFIRHYVFSKRRYGYHSNKGIDTL